MTIQITEEIAAKVLEIVDAGLVSGVGMPVPGQMCVEAAVCLALGEPHGDQPTCVSPALRAYKITLNDAAWSSPEARARGLRELAILQLGTKDTLDAVEFARRLALVTVNKILPPMLRLIGLEVNAQKCEAATNLNIVDAARAAYAAGAARAAAAAAYAATAATAARAATAAADAARAAYAAGAATAAAAAAAYADADADADADTILTTAAEYASEILIDMKVPGVQWLNLL